MVNRDSIEEKGKWDGGGIGYLNIVEACRDSGATDLAQVARSFGLMQPNASGPE